MSSELKTLKAGDLRPEVGIITGTRPGIIMMAPVVKALQARHVPHFVIHSSQHYSPSMDSEVFADLELPDPDYRLEGTRERATHGAQTAAMLEGIEVILMERRPAVMLVYGDTNSNLAAALAARKLHINVAHVEAGERSGSWIKPEEHNRRMIDAISDVLLATGEKAVRNLRAEGIPDSRIVVTGNPIVDASMNNIDRARSISNSVDRLDVSPGRYGIMTLHREENTDDESKLVGAFEGVSAACAEIGLDEVLMLAHPRTVKRIEQYGREEWARGLDRLRVTAAVPFLDFINLLVHARMVFTDSGGVSQEALIHRVPCVNLLDQTEWMEAVEVGAQELSGCDPARIVAAAIKLDANKDRDWGWPFGGPDSSDKIVDVLVSLLDGSQCPDARGNVEA